ncbi:Uncharacterized protein dnm_028490 [Desulfonema magnum]|uniref:Uncharacterized protein n=1 Tax=Desulfonema magnum TaxID=45655 RepID=A0A975BK13_9BACT|nr:Uncharacterized protein dnm_028490 [Desulfonema magnum]
MYFHGKKNMLIITDLGEGRASLVKGGHIHSMICYKYAAPTGLCLPGMICYRYAAPAGLYRICIRLRS